MDPNTPLPFPELLALFFAPRPVPPAATFRAALQAESVLAAFQGPAAEAELYHPYAKVPFSAWLDRYASALKGPVLQGKYDQARQDGVGLSWEDIVRTVPYAHVFLPLLRSDDLDKLEHQLDTASHPCMDVIYFTAGFYDRAEELKLGSWQQRKLDLIPSGLNYDWIAIHPQKPDSPNIVSDDELTREERHRLCSQFEALGLIGNSPAMMALYKKIDDLGNRTRAWPKNLPTVLVYGKPGSGKELVARAIHARSGREGKFIAVNCAAIPKDLFESELFGHSAGAFTGATGSRAGIFEEAQNGTVFLDEINKMPVDQQGKLLRVLENKEARRVGTSGNYPVNALVVTATNEDLQEKAHDNKFLQDLYSRLLQPALVVPPLRYRTEDTPLLVNHILQQRFPGTPLDQYRFPLALFCEGYLTEYSSVRDLINLIETVVTRVGTPVESDPCYSKLLQAVATAERTGRPPFSRAKLAGIMNMARSNLSTQPWKTAVDRLVDEGKIESRV